MGSVITEEELAVIIFSTVVILHAIFSNEKATPRKSWTKPWLRRRQKHGAYHALIQEMRLEDAEKYQNFLRMDTQSFDLLLNLVKHLIEKEDTFFRAAIPAEERLLVTLRYLATDVGYQWRISDGGVFRNSRLYTALENNTLCVPDSAVLPDHDVQIPCFLLADEAFPLKNYIMKPYPRRNLEIVH
ncbi:UNVERIFIED_CONTAM: hypothetical protein FKN15_050819 [Acipenser sinensis]